MTRLLARSIVLLIGFVQLFGCATPFPSSLPGTWAGGEFGEAHFQPPPPSELRLPELDEEAVSAERRRHYDEAMEELQRALARLEHVSAPLLVEASRHCLFDRVPYLGLSLLSLQDLRTWSVSPTTQQEVRESARRVLQVGEGATVVALVPGSPAARAGVALRDVIRAINGRPIASSRDLREALRLSLTLSPSVVGDPRTGLRLSFTGPPSVVVVERKGAVSELSLEYVAACDIPIHVRLDPSLFAGAQRRTISITSGMMDFAESDDELATILGHEIAHVILKHRPPRSFWMRLSPEARVAIERQADYVGCYLAAAAGFDVSKTPGLWRRIARAAPDLISISPGLHDGSPERVVLVEKTVREIREKQKRGLALVPEVSQ